jgi:hypothetical protein
MKQSVIRHSGEPYAEKLQNADPAHIFVGRINLFHLLA